MTPLFGWKHDETVDLDYIIPFYYHRTSKKKEWEMTVLIPLLSAYGRGQLTEDVSIKGAAALPLLTYMGSGRWKNREAEGYFSPYLVAGSLSWEEEDFSAKASGAVFLPWIPLFDDFLTIHLYTEAGAGGVGGRYDYWDFLAWPNLGLSLVECRSAGIEDDFRLFNVWDISLCRKAIDLPGVGLSPHLREFDTTRFNRSLFASDPSSRLEALPGELDARLDQARSGQPVEHIGLIDPMIVLEQRGEEVKAFGIEPLFYYDEEQGFSIPLLFSSFGGEEGFDFFGKSTRHLFPLLHGNDEGTRYGFLANLGTLYRLDEYTAVDLKLLFNYQRLAGRGYATGLLPFPSWDFPRSEFRGDVRFNQLSGHALSLWNLDGQKGVEILPPLLFSWYSGPKKDGWRALLFFGSMASGEDKKDIDRRAFFFNYSRTGEGSERFGLLPFNLLFNWKREPDGSMGHGALWTLLYRYDSGLWQEGDGRHRRFRLGPFGLLCDYEWVSGRWMDSRFLLIFGYESDGEDSEFDFLGIPLF